MSTEKTEIMKPINYATQEFLQIILHSINLALQNGLPIVNIQAAMNTAANVVDAQVNAAVKAEEARYQEALAKQEGDKNVK